MAKSIRELMSKSLIKLAGHEPVSEAARRMREANVGAVVVEENGKPCGIVTDRDIVVRVVADDRDGKTTPLSAVSSRELTTVSPEDDIDRAVQLMRDKAIRRLLVCDARGAAVGIVSLGDLALERDAKSVLGQVSAAPPNR
ncbi:MAG: CBS domain-containing protein [Myxococcales bacterium]|nr:CBS domain-containing protein [Myxococcales bacterium]